jgi:hypothetical protein
VIDEWVGGLGAPLPLLNERSRKKMNTKDLKFKEQEKVVLTRKYPGTSKG